MCLVHVSLPSEVGVRFALHSPFELKAPVGTSIPREGLDGSHRIRRPPYPKR